ncbi:rotatin isoform X1, partial [Tachysurus ichikawai]
EVKCHTTFLSLITQRYDKTQFQDPLKKVTAKVLMPLLACSSSAQSYACKAGLLDSCVEQMKQLHSQLHLESVRPGKTAHKKKVTRLCVRVCATVCVCLPLCACVHVSATVCVR